MLPSTPLPTAGQPDERRGDNDRTEGRGVEPKRIVDSSQFMEWRNLNRCLLGAIRCQRLAIGSEMESGTTLNRDHSTQYPSERQPTRPARLHPPASKTMELRARKIVHAFLGLGHRGPPAVLRPVLCSISRSMSAASVCTQRIPGGSGRLLRHSEDHRSQTSQDERIDVVSILAPEFRQPRKTSIFETDRGRPCNATICWRRRELCSRTGSVELAHCSAQPQ
jgi:hypothetical protein